jgi:hypothetical protein
LDAVGVPGALKVYGSVDAKCKDMWGSYMGSGEVMRGKCFKKISEILVKKR